MDMMFGGGAFGGRKRPAVTLQRQLNSHNNFLAKTGHLSSNLTNLNAVTIPQGYGQLVVYLISNITILKREYPLPHGKPSTINLAHIALTDTSAA
jgi:hypothetical protein